VIHRRERRYGGQGLQTQPRAHPREWLRLHPASFGHRRSRQRTPYRDTWSAVHRRGLRPLVRQRKTAKKAGEEALHFADPRSRLRSLPLRPARVHGVGEAGEIRIEPNTATPGPAVHHEVRTSRHSAKFCIQQRDPPFKHHPTRARHGEQIAVPRAFGGVDGRVAVGRWEWKSVRSTTRDTLL